MILAAGQLTDAFFVEEYVFKQNMSGNSMSIDLYLWLAARPRFSIRFLDLSCMQRFYKEPQALFKWSVAKNKEGFPSCG